MKEQLITFETARLAKEKGWDIFTPEVYPVIDFYNHYKKGELSIMIEESMDQEVAWQNNYFVYAPTQSLLQKWLREVHNIHVETVYEQKNKTYWHSGYFGNGKDWTDFKYYKTYEEALEAGLQESLKLIH